MTVEMPKTQKQKAKERLEKNLNKMERQQKLLDKLLKQVSEYVENNQPVEPLDNVERYPLGSQARRDRVDFKYLYEKYTRKQKDIKKLQELIERQKVQYENAKDELSETDKNNYLEAILPPTPQVLLELQEKLLPDVRKTLEIYYYRHSCPRSESSLDYEAKERAKGLIKVLWRKIFEKTGNIVRYCNVYDNGLELNGYFYGEKGRVHVHTIYAGGYNIQCLHLRTLITEL